MENDETISEASVEILNSKKSHLKYMKIIKDENSSSLFACKICGSKLTREYSLRLHVLSHFKIKRYQCEICERRYSSLQYLREHKCMHTGQFPFVCPEPDCELRFRRSSKLNSHCRLTNHGEKAKRHQLSQSKHQQTEFADLSGHAQASTGLVGQLVEKFNVESYIYSPLGIPLLIWLENCGRPAELSKFLSAQSEREKRRLNATDFVDPTLGFDFHI